jgi:hypothetical protein
MAIVGQFAFIMGLLYLVLLRQHSRLDRRFEIFRSMDIPCHNGDYDAIATADFFPALL